MDARSLIALAAAAGALVVAPLGATAQGPAELRARFDALQAEGRSPFGIPLFIRSSQSEGRLAGDIYSRLDQPFEAVRRELSTPRAWCEIMILHPNVRGCTVDPGDKSLTVRLGSAETPATFSYEIASAAPDYVHVRLSAAQGPFGTSDYVFRVEAMPIGERATLLHFGYSHGYGMRAKFALQTYFGTFGRDKVGFTVVDRTPDGQPVYVDDLRGGLERNAMRYYLAIQAHVASQAAPPAQRLEAALAGWMREIERYPRQLAEESGYVERKRGDIRRFVEQRTAARGASPRA